LISAFVGPDLIDPTDLFRRVGSDEDGASLLFVGVVRDHADGRPVSGMRYDAYADMAQTVLSEIASEAAVRLGTDRLVVVHRTGDLAIGEVSVAIAASSPHRAESFDATRYVIEEIKSVSPSGRRNTMRTGPLSGSRAPFLPLESQGDRSIRPSSRVSARVCHGQVQLEMCLLHAGGRAAVAQA
jgi:molybdopterin synthase catalytic subunit